MESDKPKIVVILGPTASGKSALAVTLAKKYGGEIISADSRQVYRGMDIGTGKVTKREMRGALHHLLSVVSPKRVFTVAQYQKMAERRVREILKRKKLPIISGGTGFYIQALVDNIILPDVPPNPKLRKRLAGKSIQKLFAELKTFDPKFAKKVDSKNPRRLIRAIEIARTLGSVPPLLPRPPYHPLFIGIVLPKEELRARIHRRLLARMKKGMLREVRNLHKSGVSWGRLEELGLEYRFCSLYLRDKLTKQELITGLESAINKYANRQMTWFKKDKRISWIKNVDRKKAARLVKRFLNKE